MRSVLIPEPESNQKLSMSERILVYAEEMISKLGKKLTRILMDNLSPSSTGTKFP